jgi:2-polyprenyl-6-methoxyphenol hydroxylase and related FAD-dependent oxidoreductases
LSAPEQFELVERAFAGDGWEVPRLLAAMRTADDLFFDSVSQIRMTSWTKGRVALVGDAGYAPSFLSGQGSSLAVVGAYQLAARWPRPAATTGWRSRRTSSRCAISSSRTSNWP